MSEHYQRGVVAAGHPLAAAAGLEMLRQGGNAFDAGVAAGLCLNTVHDDMTSFPGVAPVILHEAASGRIITYSGLGRWPRRATLEAVAARSPRGVLEHGLFSTVTPAAADAWLTVLEHHGRLSFRQVVQPALRAAAEGFPAYPFQFENMSRDVDRIRKWPDNARIFLADGQVPPLGSTVRRPGLAATFRRMIEAEARGGIGAARAEFYQGETARRLLAMNDAGGGFHTADDLAGFRVQAEAPVVGTWGEYAIYGCGPWCQGPSLQMALHILAGFDLGRLGHNTPEYIHVVTEAFKLAFADREAYFGDPEFLAVPIAGLLDHGYARQRAAAIRMDRAYPELPPWGDPWAVSQEAWRGGPDLPLGAWKPAPKRVRVREAMPVTSSSADNLPGDTSYVAAMDAEGNLFSATPSDPATDTPCEPTLDFGFSSRGRQSRLDPEHPSSIAPWKRPRLTPMPALLFRNGRPWAAIGTPGGDVQAQAMAQVFLNMAVFGMAPQEAVLAPRFAGFGYPNSFAPHAYFPGLLSVEARIPAATRSALAELGHKVQVWRERDWLAGSVLVAMRGEEGLTAAADNRRAAHAMGW